MKIYTDEECKCHTANTDGTFQEFDVPYFDNKCQSFIEGHRYCPEGGSYTREDGEIFRGGCVVPWKLYDRLDAAQAQYEAMLADMDNAYAEGVASA